jgi:2-octaprenylphenol hydroxylase
MYDVIIMGSGIVGATTALAIARETSLKIAIIEKNSPVFTDSPKQYDHRVSAISLASKTIFQNLHCWESIRSKRVSGYSGMHVWDAISKGEIHFDASSLNEAFLGYIIEDSLIRSSLLEHFKDYTNIDFLCPLQINTMQEKSDSIELITEDNKTLSTKLLIAADGAESWVRRCAKIELTEWDYEHTAIVTTVKTTLPHQATAWQRFLPQGPLAFLPLDDPHHCSIVWSAVPDYATYLLSLDNDAFCKIISAEFENKLENIITASPRHSFPLRMRHAKKYVKSRLALIGDAAHTIHPLAGQGVNLGLLDAATLAEVIIDAHKKNRDFSSLSTLRRYERWRKSDTLLMLALVEGLKHLFASDKKSLQHIRHLGLTMTNHFPFIKNWLASYAVGHHGDLPRLAKSPPL